jgi:lysozyme
MSRRVNDETVRLIKQWEGFRAEAYLCPANKWTIGYGHTATAMGYRARNERITEEQGEVLLTQDLAWAEAAITRLVKVPLTDNQFGALVSWVFNMGETPAVRNSTLLRKLNEGDYTAVPQELLRWNRVSGKVSQGLVNRRAAEVGLWVRGSHVAGSDVQAEPPQEVQTIRDAAATDTGRGAGTVAIFGAVAAALPQTAPVVEALGKLAPVVSLALIAVALVGVLIWRTRRS